MFLTFSSFSTVIFMINGVEILLEGVPWSRDKDRHALVLNHIVKVRFFVSKSSLKGTRRKRGMNERKRVEARMSESE